MLRGPYRTIEELMQSPWAGVPIAQGKKRLSDRVLRSTKLEDSIYGELRAGDSAMDEIEADAGEKLRTFPALSRDVYQAFYSLMPRRNEETDLSRTAQKFNKKILDHIMQDEDYPTIKNVCEGRELPAYEAAVELVSRTAGELDRLLSDFGGDKGALHTLEKLQKAENSAAEELSGLLERLRQSKSRNETLEKAALKAANKAESKRQQVEAVSKMIDATAAQHKDSIVATVAAAVKAAAGKAEEVHAIIGSWSEEPGNMERNEVNTALLAHVRENPNLKAIARYLGRFRKIFAEGKRNSFTYGRGEKYSLELGNNLSRALTSELVMLACPVTIPLLLQKYQRKQIKQYKRREPIYKGMGDMIVCLDESGSTAGDDASWGKAVALTLLDIAAENKRKYALIHFAGPGSFRTDVFCPGEYTVQDMMNAAECFLNGGTNFETPLTEAIRLMASDGFENADIVFITDGSCALPDEFTDRLRKEQTEKGFHITGVLLDAGSSGWEFSLKSFCQNIYRTSELMGEDIVRSLIRDRA